MKNFLVFLIFVMGEITIGKAVRCQQCKAVGAEDCSGDFVECENKNDFCAQTIEIHMIGDDKRVTAWRGCKNVSAVCTETYVLNSRNFLMLIANKCCCKDDCNSEKMEMPEHNTTKNGVVCKSCFVEGSYECEEYEPFPCTGNANLCMVSSADATRPCGVENKYGFLGCASKLSCDFTFAALVETKAHNRSAIICN